MPSKTFNLSLPEGLVTRVDGLAKRQFKNRSELIRDALAAYLQENEPEMVLREPKSEYGSWPDSYFGSQRELWSGINVAEYLERERNAW